MFRRIADRLPQRAAPPAPGAQPRMITREAVKRVGLLALVAALTVVISLNQERLSGLAALGYVGAFLAMALANATLILPAPGLIFIFALGSSLHPLGVGVCAGLGATLGELTGYVAGYSGVGIAENSAVVLRVQAWMERRGLWTIFVLSVVPNPIFDIAGILAGASRIPVWRFMSITMIGKILQGCAVALAGSLSLSWVQNLLS